jgi:hypothetical protein
VKVECTTANATAFGSSEGKTLERYGLFRGSSLESLPQGFLSPSLISLFPIFVGGHTFSAGPLQIAQNYIDNVFEHVFSDGAWWAATLDLIMHHARGKSARDQWIQPADSVEIQALWLSGISLQSQKRADTVPLAASLTSRCAS